MKESRTTSTFSLAVYTEKLKKRQNTVFGYKKKSKFKINIIFEKFKPYLYNNSTLIFHVNSFWKDLQPKVYFSLAFYAEKLKNDKIHFLVTRSGQKINLMSFSDPRPKNYIYFISELFFPNDFFSW